MLYLRCLHDLPLSLTQALQTSCMFCPDLVVSSVYGGSSPGSQGLLGSCCGKPYPQFGRRLCINKFLAFKENAASSTQTMFLLNKAN